MKPFFSMLNIYIHRVFIETKCSKSNIRIRAARGVERILFTKIRLILRKTSFKQSKQSRNKIRFLFYLWAVLDLCDGKPAVIAPWKSFFIFLQQKCLKKGLKPPWISIKNHFSSMIAASSLVFWIQHCLWASN